MMKGKFVSANVEMLYMLLCCEMAVISEPWP
jgi:hypothetical protein